MKTKRIVIGLIVLGILIAGIYAWSEFTRTVQRLDQVAADYQTSAGTLVHEFESDEAAAAKKYNNKIVTVTGIVKGIDRLDHACTVVLGDTTSMSSVRCLMDSTATAAVNDLVRGKAVAIKGALTGFKKDETGLLGSDVELNRCVIE